MSEGQSEYLNTLTKWILGAGAAGVAARSALGIGDMLGESTKPDLIKMSPPSMLNVPFKPTLKGQEEESKAVRRIPKLAADKTADLQGWFGGDKATTESEVPVGGLVNVLGGAAAGYGGWRAADWLLKKKKERDNKDELELAQQQYHQALMDQYKPMPLSKVKSIKMSSSPLQDTAVTEKLLSNDSTDPNLTKLASSLDKLSDLVTKKADGDSTWLERNLGSLAHHYGYLAGALGLGAGVGAYHLARDEQNPKAIKAQRFKEEAEARAASRPNEMYARMIPVDDSGSPISPKKLTNYNLPDAHRLNLMNEPEKIAQAFIDELYSKKKASDLLERSKPNSLAPKSTTGGATVSVSGQKMSPGGASSNRAIHGVPGSSQTRGGVGSLTSAAKASINYGKPVATVPGP